MTHLLDTGYKLTELDNLNDCQDSLKRLENN